MIGCIDLHNINTTHQKAEIGYWLDKDFNKKGIMSNCVNKMVQLAFNSLNPNKLIILVEKDNIPSNNVAKKAGFSFDGLEREELKRVKGFVDVNKYSLLKSDYQKTL